MMRVGRLLIMLSACTALAGSHSLAQTRMAPDGSAKDTGALAASGLQDLYNKVGGRLLWYCNSCEAKRMALLDYISRSDTLGLEPGHYLGGSIKRYFMSREPDSDRLQNADREISKLALRFSGDLYAGAGRAQLFSYDEVSPQFAEADMKFLVQLWSEVDNEKELVDMLGSLEPRSRSYKIYKKELRRLPASEKTKRSALVASMNYYRWIHHFSLDSFILINIPAAYLSFQKGENTVLRMRAVVGTPDSRTPRLASHVSEVTLYPYWNMPRSILVNEWFGIFKDNPSLLDYYEMELVNSEGAVVSPGSVNWKSMNAKNFPYRVRQKTGCKNPLGVVKFGLSNPFDVFLHDTNVKGAFEGTHRYYSHGCVRVEDPIRLANAILPGKVDERYLNACFSDQKPQVLQVSDAVPVFIVYMLAEVDTSGKVNYHRDIYQLFAN